MKISSFLLILFSIQSLQPAYSQHLKEISDKILSEGIAIYNTTKAAQNALEFVYTKLSSEGILTYISYKEADTIKVIFLKSADKKSNIRYTFTYYPPYLPEDVIINGMERRPSKKEKAMMKSLNTIYSIALKKYSFFEPNPDVTLNMTYLLENKTIKVNVFSIGNNSEEVPFGNDYLLTFNLRGKLKSKEKIHNNLIIINKSTEEINPASDELSIFHTHSSETLPYITPTDIAVTLLNNLQTQYSSHVVFSKNFVSYFNIPDKKLTIMKREDLNK